MSQNLDRVKDTIQKLLNLAKNDAASEGEVNNAMKFVAKLMREHSLTEEDFANYNRKQGLDAVNDMPTGESRVARGLQVVAWHGAVAMFVCELLGTVKVYQTAKTAVKLPSGIFQTKPDGSPMYSKFWVFYGVAEEANLASELFGELLFVITAMAKLKYGKTVRGAGYDYCLGFANGLRANLKTAKLEEQKTTSTGLIVARNELTAAKLNRADEYQRQKIGRLTTRKAGRGANDLGAYRDGQADGAKHRVNPERKAKICG